MSNKRWQKTNCGIYVKQNTNVVVQSLSCVWLFATPWTTAHQASLSFTVSQFAQIHVHWVAEISNTSSSATPFSFCLQSFPASGSFPVSWLFTSGGQSIGASASASILPYSGLISFRIDWLDLLAVQGVVATCSGKQTHSEGQCR